MVVDYIRRCPLIGEVPPSPNSLKGESRASVTNDRQQIFQAFRIQEGVSSLAKFLLILLLLIVNVTLQITGTERDETIKQAITSLFQVTNLPVFSRDAGFQAEMREKQMAYGTLLDSRGLMDMTEDEIARIVENMKCNLHKYSMVRNSSSLNINSIT